MFSVIIYVYTGVQHDFHLRNVLAA